MLIHPLLIVPALVLVALALLESMAYLRRRFRAGGDDEAIRQCDLLAVQRARRAGSWRMKARPLGNRKQPSELDLYQVTPMGGGQSRNNNPSLNQASSYFVDKKSRS